MPEPLMQRGAADPAPDPARRPGDLLLVLGAGGHGKVTAETAMLAGWREVRFFDDALPAGSTVMSCRVEGPLSLALNAAPGAAAIVAIGDARLRLAWLDRLATAGLRLPVVVAPSATVSPRAVIGAGSVIVAGAIVAVEAVIGRGAIINTASSVDHDCRIDDGVHVAPGARLGGGVTIGARSWIGIGATVRQGLRVGCDVMVGAGAAVVEDLPDGARVAGVPARPLAG